MSRNHNILIPERLSIRKFLINWSNDLLTDNVIRQGYMRQNQNAHKPRLSKNHNIHSFLRYKSML